MSTSEILREMHRRIVRSFLDIIVLAKLNELRKPIGAHEVVNFIQQEFGIIHGPDSLYAFLCSCEKDGLIKSSHIGGIKQYSLTTKGMNTLTIITQEKPRIINSILEFLLIEMSSF